MDIDSISSRAKDGQSATKIFDVHGRRIYPGDVVVFPRHSGRGVEVGIVEKMTKKGLKLLADSRVFTSNELLVLPNSEDDINGIIDMQRARLEEFKKKPKSKKTVTYTRYAVVMKKDLLTGERYIDSMSITYDNYATKESIAKAISSMMDRSRFDYMIMCSHGGELYFSGNVDDDILLKPYMYVEKLRYVTPDELKKRPFDLHSLKSKLTISGNGDGLRSFDDEFVFESEGRMFGVSSDYHLVYPVMADVKDGACSANMHTGFGMPVNSIIKAVFKDACTVRGYMKREAEVVSAIKKALKEI